MWYNLKPYHICLEQLLSETTTRVAKVWG